MKDNYEFGIDIARKRQKEKDKNIIYNNHQLTFFCDGAYFAVVNKSSPYITIYKRSGNTFIKLNNFNTLPTG